MVFKDPLTAFGSLSVPFFISNIITLLGFLLATWFAIKYTNIFYEGRPLPKSWFLIITGFIALSLGEIGGFYIAYRDTPIITEGASILGATMLGVTLIAVGCYQLSREIS